MVEISDLNSARAELQSLLTKRQGGGLVVMSGAGISTESGIPDFRSPGGLWSQMRPIQFDDFVFCEESRLEDWRRRFEMKRIFDAAFPNAAHLTLAGLAKNGQLDLLITQNVDGLHQRGGMPTSRMVELHGNSTYATCLDCGARAELADQEEAVRTGQTPVCSLCGGLLKAAVVSFGQMMPRQALEKSASAAQKADLFIVIGSSLVVHPAAVLPEIAVDSGARLIILNREETPLDAKADLIIRAPISDCFERLAYYYE